jgi:beta-phosphoglucomutase-like phosphatase (HAD superfamily)
VTSCTRALAEVRLRAAGLPIPAKLITSTDVVHGKPDPEPYLKGASVLGVAASGCVVVEDAPAGIQAGKAAGARVIGFSTTMARPLLEKAGADWIVANCASIAVAKGTAQASQSGLLLTLTD